MAFTFMPLNKHKMMRMSKSGLIPQINLDDFYTYEPCIKGKMTAKTFSKCWKSSDLLEIVHSDICGPLRTKTHQGMEYFVTFTDDYLRYGYIYLLKYKSEVVEKFKEFKLKVKNQLRKSIKSLNNDRGGEYETFDQFCKGMRIKHIHYAL
jgi:hypothetical protein